MYKSQNQTAVLVADASKVSYVECYRETHGLAFRGYPNWVLSLMRERCITFGKKAIEVELDMENYLSIRAGDYLVLQADGALVKYSRSQFNQAFIKE